MEMTTEEIVRHFNQASDKAKDIKVLADLNCVSPGEIRKVLAEAGVEIPAPVRKGRKKAEAPKEADPVEKSVVQKGGAPERSIYRRIETILEALTDRASVYARRQAMELVVTMFKEYLEERLGEGGGADEP